MGQRATTTRTGEQVTTEQVIELFEFLTEGKLPEGWTCKSPRLSKRKAFSVIWYLQERLGVLPDIVEQCCKCGDLFNDEAEGIHIERTGRHYCESCAYHVRY